MNNSKKVKRWLKRHHFLTTIIIGIVGIVLFIIGFTIKNNDMLRTILIEIGLAILANMVLLGCSLLYFKEDDDYEDAKEIYEEKGLVNIYDSKKEMNEKINRVLLPKYKVKEYDVLCCGGLVTLRKEEGDNLIEYIKRNGLRIRILTANPHLDCLLQRKIDENCILSNEFLYNTNPVENTIKNDIFNLNEWVEHQRNLLPDNLKDNLQIRFYNSLPPIQLHRVGNHMFIGQSRIGYVSQSLPSYEFVNSDSEDDYFSKYCEYFEKLWNAPNIVQATPKVTLNPQLIINNDVIDNILKLASSDIASEFDINSENGIGVSLTICGYPQPLSDGKERRYNTNIIRAHRTVDVQRSNGISINGKKIGYEACDEKQVVGRCIKSGNVLFEVTCEESRYSILAIPLKNNENKVVAAMCYEFDIAYNTGLGITEDNNISNVEKKNKVIKKAKNWSNLISNYLKLHDN